MHVKEHRSVMVQSVFPRLVVALLQGLAESMSLSWVEEAVVVAMEPHHCLAESLSRVRRRKGVALASGLEVVEAVEVVESGVEAVEVAA